MIPKYPCCVVTADKQPALREENSGMSVLAWPKFIEPNIWTVHAAK